METKNIHARAQVTVTLTLALSGRWGSGCKMDQVFMQAAESAKGRIRHMLQEAKIGAILHDVEVTAILAEEAE